MRWKSTSLVVAALALVGGCSKGTAATKTVPSVTATEPTTTTTAAPTATLAPLTGLPLEDASKATRVALIVKIDNANEARPQAGLIEADVVFEEQVEGGITRLAAVFQSNDASPVGPIRSVRTTDINIFSALNKPMLGYSGGNKIFLNALHKSPIVDVGVDTYPKEYRRDKSRRGPHDLFSDTPKLYAHAKTDAVAPPALFQYRTKDQPATGAGAVPASHAQVTFNPSLAVITWDWDAASGTWKRGQNHTADVDLAGCQAAGKNVIIQFVNYHNVSGIRDPSGAPVPEGTLIGTGEAWLLTDGHIVKGTWSKPSNGAVTTYTDAAGAPFQLTPGQTWVELPPAGTATVS